MGTGIFMTMAEGKERSGVPEHSILALIRARGFQLSRWNHPREMESFMADKSEDADAFYRFMHRYSHRLILHDLFRLKPRCQRQELTHYVSRESLSRILARLETFGLITCHSDGGVSIHFPREWSVGWLLEWYLASLLDNEFASPAIFNVGLLGTETGGDFDVLAGWGNRLLYIETKSAPPKGIHNPEIAAFLTRIHQLKPDLAVFLNDTHLRVKDKIVLMFEEELIHLKGIGSLKQYPVERVQGQIFHIQHALYIMNSKRDIRQNLRIVFHDHLQHRGAFGWLF